MAASGNDRVPCPGSGTREFHYRNGVLHCEDLSLVELARTHGTPLYVYSSACVRERFREIRSAFGAGTAICYAVKANSNLSILKLLASLGAGFDLVSGGELQRLLAAGIDPSNAVFAGVAKARWEVELGVQHRVRAFQVESPHELALLSAAGAAAGRRVPIELRINPAVAVDTHAYIATARRDSKFGVDLQSAAEIVARIAADPHLELVGYHVHLGSQLREVRPYVEAFEAVASFARGASERLRGAKHYDFGGGFGIGYGKGDPFPLRDLAAALLPRIEALGLQPMCEPGRYLVGDAGVLVTEVLGHKRAGTTSFVLVDAAMNDLLRPALYSAEHPIAPVRAASGRTSVVDVVGPVCESGDFLARGRELPHVEQGEHFAVLAAGAYGASMASCYNTRRRPAEVLVDGSRHRRIRRRESFAALWADEDGNEDLE